MWKASLLHPKMFNTKGYSGKESEGAAGDKKSLLFLFFFARKLCHIAVSPPMEQRSAIFPSGCGIPKNKVAKTDHF
jgi:hypothetical protein